MLWLAGLGWALAGAAVAQDPVDAGEMMTLHVTVKELQVAALVTDRYLAPVKSLEAKRFRLQVDNGKLFAPAVVHREGDDPLSVAVLLDLSRRQKKEEGLVEGMAGLRKGLLLEHDRLMLFAVDCRISTYVAETDTEEGVRKAVQTLLGNTQIHPPEGGGKTCAGHLPLWDATVFVLAKLAKQPGRHVLLLISDGWDTGSRNKVEDVVAVSTSTATTMFGLPPERSLLSIGDPLHVLTQRSGGLVLAPANGDGYGKALKDWVGDLRERYILGFTQPKETKAGRHRIETVVIGPNSYQVRTSGVSSPVD